MYIPYSTNELIPFLFNEYVSQHIDWTPGNVHQIDDVVMLCEVYNFCVKNRIHCKGNDRPLIHKLFISSYRENMMSVIQVGDGRRYEISIDLKRKVLKMRATKIPHTNIKLWYVIEFYTNHSENGG